MTDRVRATVVVPTFRGRPVLTRCLGALRDQSAESFEVVVVDDGSGDGTGEWVRRTFPDVRVVALPENRGFCGAVNRGIEAARGEYIALLNDDATPEPEWLAALLAGFAGDERTGFCVSRMVQADAPTVLDGAGDEYSRYGLSFRVGRGEVDRGYPARPVLFASGGASSYRRAMFEEIGLFDERLEAYYEDVDLGLRAWERGWRGRYVPEATVAHVGSWSERSARSTTLTTRNALLVIAKHWPWRLILRHLPWLLYGQARNALWAIRAGRGRAWLVGFVEGSWRWPRFRRAHRRGSAVWTEVLALRHPFGAQRRVS